MQSFLQKISFGAGTLIVALSCGSPDNFKKSGISSLGASIENTPEVTTTTIEPSREETLQTADSSREPHPSVDTRQEMATQSSAVAVEPISVGGAYLTCRYQGKQPQYGADWPLTCSVMGIENLKDETVTASFAKIDGAGLSIPLTITSFDRPNLSWILAEKSSSVPFVRIEAIIKIGDLLPITLKTTIVVPPILTLNPAYWLFNEPNNVAGVEHCVEFVNNKEKANHAASKGTASSALARYNDRACTSLESFLCRRISAPTGSKWIITTTVGPFADYQSACPSGYSFSIPMDLTEHNEVAALVETTPVNGPSGAVLVWVAANELEKPGEWRILLK